MQSEPAGGCTPPGKPLGAQRQAECICPTCCVPDGQLQLFVLHCDIFCPEINTCAHDGEQRAPQAINNAPLPPRCHPAASPQIGRLLHWKAPMVGFVLETNWSAVKRSSRLLLPTEESPTSRTCRPPSTTVSRQVTANRRHPQTPGHSKSLQ